MTNDLDLHENVLEQLTMDPRVDAGDVAIGVRDGVVTLSGTVSNLMKKWDIEAAVKRVRGVRAIANEITVEVAGVHQRTDADIARAIQERLTSSVYGLGDLQVVVQDGQVALNGEVGWHYQRDEAVLEALRVFGVKNITTTIAVKNEFATI